MNKNKITVLGSGNTGISTAAKLSHDGFEIILAEIPEFESSILDIKENKTILLKNKSTEVKTSIKDVTSDLKLALKDADIILVAAPAYAHKNLAEKCAPHLNSDQIIVLMPGTLGSLEWAKIWVEISEKKMLREWCTSLYYGAKKEFSSKNGPFLKIY